MEALLKFLNITQREGVGIAFGAPLFFVYWKFLNAFVVKHFVALFEEREALTQGAHTSSEDTLNEAKRLLAQTEAKLNAARVEANKERTEELEAAKESALKIVHEAEKEAADHVHKVRASLDAEVKLLNANIEQTVQQLATELAAKIQKGTSATLRFVVPFTTAIVLAALAAPAFAEEHGGHGAHHGTPADLIPYAVNFFIYISLLFYFTKKPIANAWSSRLTTIASDVDKGKKELEQAEKTLNQAKARAQSVNTEIERIKFDIQKGAQTEAQEILKDGTERALRVRQQGHSLADGDVNHTRESYRTNLSKLVVKRATELLEGQITETSDATLRKSALQQFDNKASQIIQ